MLFGIWKKIYLNHKIQSSVYTIWLIRKKYMSMSFFRIKTQHKNYTVNNKYKFFVVYPLNWGRILILLRVHFSVLNRKSRFSVFPKLTYWTNWTPSECWWSHCCLLLLLVWVIRGNNVVMNVSLSLSKSPPVLRRHSRAVWHSDSMGLSRALAPSLLLLLLGWTEGKTGASSPPPSLTSILQAPLSLMSPLRSSLAWTWCWPPSGRRERREQLATTR